MIPGRCSTIAVADRGEVGSRPPRCWRVVFDEVLDEAMKDAGADRAGHQNTRFAPLR
jgi:hypothetical protein